jgi:methylenetetrahydrofolate dehydrogenase (NADP+)/methenyltetrahydrofolate cyclohydrolase
VTARILDGRTVAARLQASLSARTAAVHSRTGEPPRLAILRFGDAGPSAVYAGAVDRAARKVGIEPQLITPQANTTVSELAATIDALNRDPQVAGIVVAQPVPDRLASSGIVDLIDPAKDPDGATAMNAGRLAQGAPAIAPATARAVMEILRAYEVQVAGRHAVVVGRSAIVGRPAATLLLAADATVTICHRRTPDLAAETRRADVLVVAAGAPGLIGAQMVQPGCVVVDCGINTTGGGITGDVDFDAVSPIVAAITPVPGGVGPVTSMMLAAQTVEIAERLARPS